MIQRFSGTERVAGHAVPGRDAQPVVSRGLDWNAAVNPLHHALDRFVGG